MARRRIAGILCVFQDFSTPPAAILAVKMGAEAIGTASKKNLKKPLIKLARAACERFFATTRRDFPGIIVFISRNHNEVAMKRIRKAPQAYLISGSLTEEFAFLAGIFRRGVLI